MQAKEEYQVKREQFAKSIRRNNREEIFAKRRNLEECEVKDEGKIKNLNVVDEKFADKVIEYSKIQFQRSQFVELIQAIYDSDVFKQLYGLTGVRKLLSNKENPPIQQVVDAGLVPRLIQYAQQDKLPQLQLEAIWCLSNVAAGSNQQCNSIIEKGGIKIFVNLLLSQHPGIIQQSVWTLGNIACDLPAYRDSIIKLGGLKNIIRVIEVAISELPNNPAMRQLIQNSSWALSTLCRNRPLPNYSLIKDAIPVFYKVLQNNYIHSAKIMGNICWALSYYVDRKKQTKMNIDKISDCINSGIVPHIISYINNKNDSLVVASLKILGNIAAGSDEQSQYLISQNAIEVLEVSLHRNQKTVRKEATWVISNICAGSMNNISAVLNRDSLVSKLIDLAYNDLPEIRCQALYALINPTQNGNVQQLVNFYGKIQIIKLFGDIIKNCQDIPPLETTLECLDYLLDLGLKMAHQIGKKKSVFIPQLFKQNLVVPLEDLQEHDSNSVYELVSKILNTYFDLENPMNL